MLTPCSYLIRVALLDEVERLPTCYCLVFGCASLGDFSGKRCGCFMVGRRMAKHSCSSSASAHALKYLETCVDCKQGRKGLLSINPVGCIYIYLMLLQFSSDT